jgi:hypothetical protein
MIAFIAVLAAPIVFFMGEINRDIKNTLLATVLAGIFVIVAAVYANDGAERRRQEDLNLGAAYSILMRVLYATALVNSVHDNARSVRATVGASGKLWPTFKALVTNEGKLEFTPADLAFLAVHGCNDVINDLVQFSIVYNGLSDLMLQYRAMRDEFRNRPDVEIADVQGEVISYAFALKSAEAHEIMLENFASQIEELALNGSRRVEKFNATLADRLNDVLKDERFRSRLGPPSGPAATSPPPATSNESLSE